MSFAVGPVYAVRSGLSTAAVALFMALSILPAVAVQLPIGRYSDRVDRRTALVALSDLAAAVALTAIWLGNGATAPFYAAVAVYGGVSLTAYALRVAHSNDHLRPEQMVAASGTIILVNGVGAILGPLLVTAAMQASGPAAYSATAAVMHLAFATYALWRKRKTAPIRREGKGHFVGGPPQVAPTGRLAAPDLAAPPRPPLLRISRLGLSAGAVLSGFPASADEYREHPGALERPPSREPRLHYALCRVSTSGPYFPRGTFVRARSRAAPSRMCERSRALGRSSGERRRRCL